MMQLSIHPSSPVLYLNQGDRVLELIPADCKQRKDIPTLERLLVNHRANTKKQLHMYTHHGAV